jgi:WD40 repeat protein
MSRTPNPAFYPSSCPVFSVAWLEGGSANGESHVLYSGGGGAARTGVHNIISISKVVPGETAPSLEEVCTVGTGGEICATLAVDTPRTEANVQLVASGIGDALCLFGITSTMELVRLNDEGIVATTANEATCATPKLARTTLADGGQALPRSDLKVVEFDRSEGKVVATGDENGAIRLYQLENVPEVLDALSKYPRAQLRPSGDEEAEGGGGVEGGEDGGGGEMRVDDATSSNDNERSKKREGKGAAALPADAPLLTAVDTPSVLGKRRGCLLRVIADAAKVLGGHTAAMTGLRFDSRGRRLCSASKDGTARVWSVASGTELCVLPTTSGLPPVYNKYKRLQRQMCRACAFSPADDDLVYTLQNASVGPSYVSVWALKKTAGQTREVQIRAHARSEERDSEEKMGQPHEVQEPRGEGGAGKQEEEQETKIVCEPLRVAVVCKLPVPCMALSPDGERLVTGDTEGGVTVSDTKTLRKVKAYAAHQLPCTSVSVASATASV